MKKIALKNAARGTAFDYAGQSWILLENDDGRALCLSKDIIETRAFDEGNCNNFAVASSKEYLNGAYLDNLLEDVNGPNAFLTTELDLTTDDGLKDYGTCTVTIFLLTVDQYREKNESLPLRNRLREVRTAQGLSQSQLADMVGVSRNTISSIETRQFSPTAKLALLLCIALDRKFEDLFYFE